MKYLETTPPKMETIEDMGKYYFECLKEDVEAYTSHLEKKKDSYTEGYLEVMKLALKADGKFLNRDDLRKDYLGHFKERRDMSYQLAKHFNKNKRGPCEDGRCHALAVLDKAYDKLVDTMAGLELRKLEERQGKKRNAHITRR